MFDLKFTINIHIQLHAHQVYTYLAYPYFVPCTGTMLSGLLKDSELVPEVNKTKPVLLQLSPCWGVYPEVLFDVARQWFELSEEAAQSNNNSDGQKRNSTSVDNKEVHAVSSGPIERGSPSTLPNALWTSEGFRACA
jgi:hypothetical protein